MAIQTSECVGGCIRNIFGDQDVFTGPWQDLQIQLDPFGRGWP